VADDAGVYAVDAGTTLTSAGTRNLAAGSNITALGAQCFRGTVNANNLLDIVETGTGLNVSSGALNLNGARSRAPWCR